jgi:hypothetical protein
MKPGFNIDKLDYSVLTDRSLNEIAGDEGSAEWESNRKAAVRKGAEWLQGSVDRVIGKSGDRRAQKKNPDPNVIKAGVAREKRNSRSATRKKSGVKKKTRRAA